VPIGGTNKSQNMSKKKEGIYQQSEFAREPWKSASLAPLTVDQILRLTPSPNRNNFSLLILDSVKKSNKKKHR
jgi:hypothetical protein